jgi:hypothetical protein
MNLVLTFYFHRNLKENEGEVSEKLKESVAESNDAKTIAHDALASIDARAQEISTNMANAKV